MKKIILSLAVIFSLNSAAQQTTQAPKGNFEVKDFGTFKLHVYNSNDALGDASYIIEGGDKLITMEQPLFKDNVAEFDNYLKELAKPVMKRIADYHIGGTGNEDLVMAEGMSQFTKQGAYAAMMQSFAQNFGDAIVALPTGKVNDVAFNKSYTWDGITFTFTHGAKTDFPAASINIGGKAYFTHWAPAKAHMNALQITSPAVIDAELAEITNALNSGCTVFIGGHGGMADKSAALFKSEYLKTMKKIYAENNTAEAFLAAFKQAYPNLQGENGLDDVAKALYGNK